MSLANQASFLVKLVKAKIQHQYFPLTVIYNITDRCNASCSYCYLRYYQRGTPEPTKEQIFTIIDELKKLGNKRISLAGGEPLIRQDIGEIINYIKDKGLDCVVNSNGILVPQKIDSLKRLDALCISIDGPEVIHDLYRGSGSFQKALAAIKCAREAGLPVNTNTVLNKSNLDSIDYILQLAKEYNLLAEFNLLIGYLPDKLKVAAKPSDDEFKTAIKTIINFKKKGYPVLMSEKAYQYVLSWPSYEIEEIRGKDPDFKHTKCMAGKYFCVIDTDGKVYACPHLIGKMKAINCYEEGFAKAFDNSSVHDCRACYQVYHNEFNLLFNLDRGIILNHTKNTLMSLFKNNKLPPK